MDNDVSGDTPEMEINVENINAKSEIILNDLRLLELIYMHPYLFSNAVDPHNDNDYEEWGWEQITNAFNCSYEGLDLSTPFSIDELRWRWDFLRPMCQSLKDKRSRLPTKLRSIMSKINQLMSAAPQMNFQENIPTQSFILEQIPFIERLPLSLQRPLEVEILNAIFMEERSEGISLDENETKLAQSEYEEFLKTIRVKELPNNETSRRNSIRNSTESNPDSSKAMASIANKHESAVVITKVQHPNSKPEPPKPQTEHPKHKPIQLFRQPLIIKEEPPDLFKVEQQELRKQLRDTSAQIQLHYVPLNKVMLYVKNVRVRVKRLDLVDYVRQSQRRQLRKCRVKMYK
ncbi:hypothetical protein AWZ03_002934 [Drosophila navojoa]|uniref:Lethal hybrid rescue protein n=1 Tax=Drosophila navojoa TaxID=7232 RepID=A0A484BRE3_DRONA|nr:uncharacterized protein LOC108652860 [Drosophila navojoa]TDG50630.1 hypothetical protein AWZ03_002934 [Drosophila navojoa]